MKYSFDIAVVRGFIGAVIGGAISPLLSYAMAEQVDWKKALATSLIIGVASALGVDVHAYQTSKKVKALNDIVKRS